MGIAPSKDKASVQKEGQEEIQRRFFGIPTILRKHEYRPIGVIVVGLGMMSAYLIYRGYLTPYMHLDRQDGKYPYEYMNSEHPEPLEKLVIINQRHYGKSNLDSMKMMSDHTTAMQGSHSDKEKPSPNDEINAMDLFSSNIDNNQEKKSPEDADMPPLEGEEPTLGTENSSSSKFHGGYMGSGDTAHNKATASHKCETFISNVKAKTMKDSSESFQIVTDKESEKKAVFLFDAEPAHSHSHVNDDRHFHHHFENSQGNNFSEHDRAGHSHHGHSHYEHEHNNNSKPSHEHSHSGHSHSRHIHNEHFYLE